MLAPSRLRYAIALALLGSGGACARATEQRSNNAMEAPGEHLVTSDEIAETGARTAWEALRQTAPYLNMGERGNGQPALLRRRGKSSIILNDAPIVVVDGVRMPDFRNLTLIPANTIDHILIMRGIDATTYYGTNAVGGVVLIRTKTD